MGYDMSRETLVLAGSRADADRFLTDAPAWGEPCPRSPQKRAALRLRRIHRVDTGPAAAAMRA